MKMIYPLVLLLTLASCVQKYSMNTRNRTGIINSPMRTVSTHPQKSETTKPVKKAYGVKEDPQNVSETLQTVIDTALSYLGTPYKASGTTRNGMDCSGLMYTSFLAADIRLNRSSHEIAEQGIPIKISDVRIGDLLFFKTTRNRAIGHVGMVIEVGNSVKFIHSSTSRGVIISDIKEPYWDKAFVKAKRIL